MLTSATIGCFSISAFPFLLGVPIGTTSFTIGFKICAIAAGFKKFRSIIKEKKNKHRKIVLLAKSKLNIIKVLIFKALINSNRSHNEFVLINKVLKEYDEMKKEIKDLKT